MKNVFDIEASIDPKFAKTLAYDKADLDNPEKYTPSRLLYVDRIEKVIRWVSSRYANHEGVQIGEIGCAQGNMSLLLAEQGFKVFAIDIDEKFLEYGRLKYEKGDISWVKANIETLDLPKNSLDVAIMGEIIEHCAYPEEIIAKTLEFVKPGGYVFITTPNGSRIKTGLPTFDQFAKKEDRKKFEELQFGPDGNDHLFLFTLKEAATLVPSDAKIIESGYLGSTILLNRRTYKLFKILPFKWFNKLIRGLSHVPLINLKTFNNIYTVLQKKS